MSAQARRWANARGAAQARVGSPMWIFRAEGGYSTLHDILCNSLFGPPVASSLACGHTFHGLVRNICPCAYGSRLHVLNLHIISKLHANVVSVNQCVVLVQVACQMLPVHLLQEADRARPSLGGSVSAACPLLLQCLPGDGAQPLQRLWGASHWHGPPKTDALKVCFCGYCQTPSPYGCSSIQALDISA